MEKYGVVTNEDTDKIASKKGKPCPQCGDSEVDYKSSTPHCRCCGTEPWEQKPSGHSQR